MSGLTNEQIVRTVIVTGDVGTPGSGLLSPKQFAAWHALARTATPWAQLQSEEEVTEHTGTLNTITVGRGVIFPAVEAVDSGDWSKPTHGHIPYSLVESQLRFKYSKRSESQAAGDYRSKVVMEFNEQYGVDRQEMAWLGDTTSADPMLAQNNGWMVAMEGAGGNVTNGSLINGGAIHTDHFYTAFQSLPNAWKQRRTRLRWAMNATKASQVGQFLSGRATGAGDQFSINEGSATKIIGIPVVEVPSMPDTKIALVDPKNTTIVTDATDFSLRPITTGYTVAVQRIVAYIGHFYSDFIIREVSGTAVINQLNA